MEKVVNCRWLLAELDAEQARGDNKDHVAPAAAMQAEPFALRDVRLLPGPFQRARELDHR